MPSHLKYSFYSTYAKMTYADQLHFVCDSCIDCVLYSTTFCRASAGCNGKSFKKRFFFQSPLPSYHFFFYSIQFTIVTCSILLDSSSVVDGQLQVKHILLEATGQVQLHRSIANVSTIN